MCNIPSLNLSLLSLSHIISWHSIPSSPFLSLFDFPVSILRDLGDLELLTLHIQSIPRYHLKPRESFGACALNLQNVVEITS
jgi:hypothetical protein